jgi:hypothetical protein
MGKTRKPREMKMMLIRDKSFNLYIFEGADLKAICYHKRQAIINTQMVPLMTIAVEARLEIDKAVINYDWMVLA